MCYNIQQTKDSGTLSRRFSATVRQEELKLIKGTFNGLDHKRTPIILHEEPEIIQCVEWGLIPFWEKSRAMQSNNLNVGIEMLNEKSSFKFILHRKCLVIVDGFFEWRQGETQQKYLITMPDNEPFALAGIWSDWQDENKKMVRTYTIITTEARGIMREINNTALRMPVVLRPQVEHDWLLGKTKAKLFTDLKVTLV